MKLTAVFPEMCSQGLNHLTIITPLNKHFGNNWKWLEYSHTKDDNFQLEANAKEQDNIMDQIEQGNVKAS